MEHHALPNIKGSNDLAKRARLFFNGSSTSSLMSLEPLADDDDHQSDHHAIVLHSRSLHKSSTSTPLLTNLKNPACRQSR